MPNDLPNLTAFLSLRVLLVLLPTLCGLAILAYWSARSVKRTFWPYIDSRPGSYHGYSRPVCDEWVRSSEYVVVRDGTKLAADLFRPARKGVPLDGPFPAVWSLVRYQRAAQINDDEVVNVLTRYPWLNVLIRHGYVVVAVDARGTGASYGVSDGPFSVKESEDAYDVTEWASSQEWCDGNVGMFGGSYMGITQYFAAGAQPPSLKAIFPQVSNFDAYSTVYLGGIKNEDFLLGWSRLARDYDSAQDDIPVDEDPGRRMLADARRQQQANRYPIELTGLAAYRDSRDPQTGELIYAQRSPLRCVADINRANIPVYNIGGWFDPWVGDQLLWYSNLDVPKKVLIGPWSHNGIMFPIGTEHLRWFDYWLKGIDNGIMEEAPIRYFTMGAPPGQGWRSAWQWPLPEERRTAYYLHAGKSGSVDSVNDGRLLPSPPQIADEYDRYTVDYSTTAGTRTRWSNLYGRPCNYGDMTLNDERGLTFTTAQLADAVEVTGHPTVSIWIRTTADDIDLYAYLEEVEEDGRATYLSDGRLRASHRVTSPAPYRDMPGSIYHRSFQEDMTPLPDAQPVKLEFNLFPISNIFDKGHRIRLTLTCADRDNTETPTVTPPPVVDVLRGSELASHIVLPVIPPQN